MVAKGISMDDFPENCVGRWSNNYTSEEPMNCLGRFSNTFGSEGSPIVLSKFGSEFSRTKSFCFENWIFLLAFGFSICEGVGEDSRHGWSCRHSSRFMKLLECDCLPCMCT